MFLFMFDIFGWLNKNITPIDYDVQEKNCVYTKHGTNKVLIVTRFKEPTISDIVDNYKAKAATLLGIDKIIENNVNSDLDLTDFQEEIYTAFDAQTLERIANGFYDEELHTYTDLPKRSGTFIKLRYGKIKQNTKTVLRLLDNDRTRFEAYMEEIEEEWNCHIQTFSRPLKLSKVKKSLISGLDDNHLEFEPLATNPQEIFEVVNTLYQAGLYWRFKKVPDKTFLALECATYKTFLKSLVKIVKKDCESPFRLTKDASTIWDAFNSRPN
jgi:hypothetical protein